MGESVGEKTNTGDLSNEGEGMNIFTHRMSVGDGEYLSTYLPTYLPTYLSDGWGCGRKTNTGNLSNEGEGMNIYTHRMSVGEGEHLPTYLPTYLPDWQENLSDNITEKCHGLIIYVGCWHIENKITFYNI